MPGIKFPGNLLWKKYHVFNYTIRKLTHVECEILQTFHDNYTVGISNTQRYISMNFTNGLKIYAISHKKQGENKWIVEKFYIQKVEMMSA